MSTHPTYVYAVARTLDDAVIAGLRGVDGMPIHCVRHCDIVAVASPLPPATADETALRARLETLDELAALASTHHAVVAGVAAHTATIPFRIATVYYGDSRVAEVLRRGYRHFHTTLGRLAGRVELGVKVYAASAAATVAPGAVSGRDYLRQRRQQRDQRDDTWRRATAAADRISATLAELAVAGRQHRPQDPRLSGAPGQNVLNAAYLVDAGRADELAEQARRLGVKGVRVEVTGPWPPYSFAAVEAGDKP